MKRTLCLFLALILAVGICFSAPVTITASAAEAVTSGNCGASTNEGGESSVTWAYDFATTTLTISGTGAMRVYKPKYTPWYGYINLIKKVVISEGVTQISTAAFYGCTSLESITIPESVTIIGNSTFVGCTSLESITIPEGVTKIGDSTFENCSKLVTVDIPASVTTIGRDAFEKCTSLESITIPESATTIDGCAFLGCTSLKSITIPKTVTTIGASAFSGCTSLSSITIPNSVTSIEYGAFNGCISLKSITIPETVTIIGGSAFYGCTSLKSITIPKSVTKIGDSAFYGCTSLASITIPETVTTIGDSAFFRIKATAVVNVPCSWAEEPLTTFSNNVNLKIEEHDYKNGICNVCKHFCVHKTITDNVCAACNGSSYGASENDSVVWFYDNGTLYIIGKGAMGNWGNPPWNDYVDSIKAVVIGEGVTTIGDNAFEECEKLESVTIPDTVEVFNRYAFRKCIALKTITIPDSVKVINADVFYGCTGLKEITISAGVELIAWDAFDGCTSLELIDVADNNKYFSSDEGVLFNSDKTKLHCYPMGKKVKDYNIPEGVTTLEKEAFYGCTELTSVTIPESVTTIGDFAFAKCTSLAAVTIGEGVTTLEKYAFMDCIALTSVTIPESVTTIGEGAFINCTSLTSVTIPASVTKIGFSAFDGCAKLISINVDGANTKYSSEDGVLFNANKTELICYPAGKTETSYTVPESVTKIGETAFRNCSGLTSVTIPKNVTTIGRYAFDGCDALTTVNVPCSWAETPKYTTFENSVTVAIQKHNYELGVCTACKYDCTHKNKDENGICTVCYIAEGTCGENVTWVYDSKTTILTITGTGDMADETPWEAYRELIRGIDIKDGVTSIGIGAFCGCISLTSVIIPGSVKTIGVNAFSGCKSLSNVRISEGVTSIGNYAFKECIVLEEITIPESVETIGKEAFNSCPMLRMITIPQNVTVIGDYAFSNCIRLTEINVDEGNTTYSSEDGVLFNEGKTELICYPAGKEGDYEVPSGVTGIADFAFSSRGEFFAVTIPVSVTTIGEETFAGCENVNLIVEPGSKAHEFAKTNSIPYIFNGYNEAETAQIEKLTFTEMRNDNSEVIEYSVSFCDKEISGALNIPATYNGKPVTIIGNFVFEDCTALSEITIPKSVTTIGAMAFCRCSSLETITIPKSVTTIWGYAFIGCDKLTSIIVDENNINYSNSKDGVLFDKNKETLICYPASKTETSYTVPESVTTISEGAFMDCIALTSVTIPESVTTIGVEAFYGCTALETVTIPGIETTIGDNAFSNCKKLILTVESGSYAHNYAKTNSIPYIFNGYNEAETAQIEKLIFTLNADSESYSVTGCDTPISGELKIPATYNGKPVTSIGIHAFSSCISLETVTIGNSVTSIGDYAFSACTALATVTIPDSVTTIGNYTFNACTALTTVTIPDSVTTIGNYTFNACTALATVTIPGSETTIGNNAFNGCNNLSTVNVPCSWNENPKYTTFENSVTLDIQKHNYELGVCTACKYDCTHENKDGNGICTDCYFAEGTCGENITWIYDSKTTTLTISGSGAMADYTSSGMPWNDCKTEITKIVIGNDVTTIGNNAFNGCYALTSVTIPDKVTKIGDLAFLNCESLTKIDLNNVEIGNNAFDGCKSVTEVNLDNCTIGIDTFLDLSSLETLTCKNTDIPNYAFHINKSLKTVTISDGEIGEGAFAECDALSSLNISGVETIGEQAFSNCIALVKIDLSDVEIGNNAFECCKSVTEINLDNCTIGINTFFGLSSLETVTCKDTDIPDYAFYMNTSLKTVTISGGEIGEEAFGICDTLKEISIANDVIGKLAFYSCKHLETIDVDTAKISESAFALCDSLKNIKLGDELKIIENSAFDKCSKLTEIVIPASVTSIDGYAFYDCSELKYIFFEGTETIGDTLVTNAKIHYGSSTHTYEENYTVDLEPTCTEKGSKSQHCKYCDLTQNSTDIDELGHTPVKGSAEDAHTICDVCKEPLSTTHNFTSKITTAPTCTEEGVETFTCECGYTYTKPIEAKGHDIVIDKAVEATCTATGLTEGSHCTRCDGATVAQQTIAKKGHTEVTVTGKAATCTEEGLTDGKKCSVCGTVTKAQETIKAKGHTTSVINKKDATCTADGYTGDTYCSVCKTTTAKGTVIKSTGHKEVVIPAVAPTFTTVGKTEGKKCSVCGTVTVAQKDVAKLTLATPTVTQKNTAKGIEVNWNKIDGAESYVVYRSVYSGGKWSKWASIKKGVTGTSYVDGTVKLGTSYKYTVRAVNGSVMSGYQNTKDGLKYNVTPTVKVALASNGIKVSWSTAANATGYTVYSSTYNTKTKKWSGWKNRGTVKANKTSWTDKSVKSGTQYKYTIRAVNGKVLSSYNKTGAATLYLAQPTVKIENASTGVKVSWNKVTGATGYTVYKSEYNSKTKKWSNWKNKGTVKSNKTSWTDTKVASGVQYKYTVRAINGKVASTYVSSNTVLYLAQPKTTVKAVSNGINVGWTQSAGATGYTVYRMEYNAKTKKWSGWKKMGTAKSSKTNWTDKSAKKGVQYKYTVKAVNGKAASTYKASGSVKR